MFASIIIGWAAEVSAIHISAGLALAILALLQTLPEFGVEAFIAWHGDTNLMLANLTGSLRLFVGLGWPMVFFIHAFSCRFTRKGAWPTQVQMPKSFCIEATFLNLPILYFMYITYKHNLNAWDGLILCSMYFLYLILLNAKRKRGVPSAEESEEDLEFVPATIVKWSKAAQTLSLVAMFIVGGGLLVMSIHPFVDGLQEVAAYFGLSQFVFIQWIAPFASEFPEKVTAFNWARRASKVPMAIFNMVSSSVNQWTLLAGFVPLIYSLSQRKLSSITFDHFHTHELMLTIAQSALGSLFLADLSFHWIEAVGLFILWLIQFFVPSTREPILYVYMTWIFAEILALLRKGAWPKGWREFYRLFFAS